MPTYLIHGFRWHRHSIRIFVGLYDLMDAAPDWILAPATSSAILEHMRELYPFIPESDLESETLSGADDTRRSVVKSQPSPVKLLEEYDPEEKELAMRPYAYVADYVVRVDLGVSVSEEMARYEEERRKAAEEEKEGEAPWFERLSEGMQTMQKQEPIQWHVVVCGDEERHVPGKDDQ